MQMLPLTEVPTEASPAAFIDELVERQLFTKDVADKIDQASIVWFYQTAVGQTLIKYATQVKRGAAIFNAKRSCHYF